MEDLSGQVGDVEISSEVEDFEVNGVDENGDLMLKMCVQNDVMRAIFFRRREKHTTGHEYGGRGEEMLVSRRIDSTGCWIKFVYRLRSMQLFWIRVC